MWKYFYIYCMEGQWQTPIWEDMESPIRNPWDTSTDSVAFGSREHCTAVFHLGCHYWNSSDKKLSTRTAVCLHWSYSVLSSLVLDFSFNYFLLSSRTEVLVVRGTWKEKVEDSQSRKDSSFDPGCSLPSLIHDLSLALLMHAGHSAVAHYPVAKPPYRFFPLPSFPSHFWFYSASKKKVLSPQLCCRHGATLRSGSGNWQGFKELQRKKGPSSTSQCSHPSSCCGTTETAEQNSTWERTKNYASHPDIPRTLVLTLSGTGYRAVTKPPKCFKRREVSTAVSDCTCSQKGEHLPGGDTGISYCKLPKNPVALPRFVSKALDLPHSWAFEETHYYIH